jgi:hypothetical protein
MATPNPRSAPGWAALRREIEMLVRGQQGQAEVGLFALPGAQY